MSTQKSSPKARKVSIEKLREEALSQGKKIHFSNVKQKLPNNRGYYVVRVEGFYDPKTKNTKTIARKIIGKLPPGETDISKMVPTDKKYHSNKIKAKEALKTDHVLKDTRRLDCVQYPLDIVLLVITMATLAGQTSCHAIAAFWAAHRATLSKLIEGFPDRDISHDTIRRIIKLLGDKAEDFVRRLTEPLVCEMSSKLYAIDGQAIRAAGKQGKASEYILNVYSCDEEICMNQVYIGNKSNEITHCQEILDDLALNGVIVTCDALNTQKKFAKYLIQRGADYCFALKKNHKKFYEMITYWFATSEASENAVVFKTENEAHGRREHRVYRILPANLNPILQEFITEWDGLEEGCVIETTTEREIISSGKISKETRYFITTLAFDQPYIGELAARVIRGHWGIENKLHWSLDLVLNQDRTQCRNADFIKGKSSINKLAYNTLSKAQTMMEEETGKTAISKPELQAKMTDPRYSLEVIGKLYGKAKSDGVSTQIE